MLKKISYRELNPKQQEIYNFQKLAGELADYGYNCIKLADDWNGADFLAYHKDGKEVLKIQMKGRLTIAKKYIGQNLFIAFPLNGFWHLIDHDKLISIIENNTSWLNTLSWKKNGAYHSAKPSARVQEAIKHARIISN